MRWGCLDFGIVLLCIPSGQKGLRCDTLMVIFPPVFAMLVLVRNTISALQVGLPGGFAESHGGGDGHAGGMGAGSTDSLDPQSALGSGGVACIHTRQGVSQHGHRGVVCMYSSDLPS